ncbi:GNAT family N-acetyltransferase [soil metagenome]
MVLVTPSLDHLPSYAAALGRGWGPDNTRQLESAREQLARIEADAERFVASLTDLEAKGAPITLPDGSTVARLPGYTQWMWDGEFCGNIGFRWQRGTTALPPHVLGHVGYSVPEWKRNRGHATRALAMLLPQTKVQGLPFIELTTDPDNLASIRVIEANGGVLFEHFTKPPQFGSKPGLRFRIAVK